MVLFSEKIEIKLNQLTNELFIRIYHFQLFLQNSHRADEWKLETICILSQYEKKLGS